MVPKATINQKRIAAASFFGLMMLLWQARQPLWNSHLQVDIWVWWERVDSFLKNGSFAYLAGNEILPATLIFILLPLGLIPLGWASYGNYLPAALLLNLGTLVLHRPFLADRRWWLIGLLALGPILLFRFDALVTLLVLISFWALEHKRAALAGLALGLATGMKVFPVIFLPYLLWLVRRRATLVIYFAEGIILPILVYLLLGGNWEQIRTALNFHNTKLISIESVPGTIITGWSLLTKGEPPALLAGNGIWAIPGPAALFNRLWLLALAPLYYLIWKSKPKVFDARTPLVLVLVFLIFSKNLNPQYLWWYMAFLPLIKAERSVWLVTIMAAVLNQLVYPLFYTVLIEGFYQKNQSYWVWYLLLLRNLGIVYLTLKILYPFWSKTTGKLAAK